MRKMVVCLSGILWGLFSGAWMFVSNRASWERAFQHTNIHGRRTCREVVVRLQRHDSILDPHPRYHPIVLDDDASFGRHTNAGGTNCGWGNSIGNDTHSATRARRADRAPVAALGKVRARCRPSSCPCPRFRRSQSPCLVASLLRKWKWITCGIDAPLAPRPSADTTPGTR